MANYINAYANQAFYDSDDTKQYPNVALLRDSGTIVHKKENRIDYSTHYFTFVAEEAGTFSYHSYWTTLDYSLDNGQTWTTLQDETNTPTIQAEEKIMWRGTFNGADNEDGHCQFSSSGQFTVEGNVMSLIYGDNFSGQTDLTGKDYVFNHMFGQCTGLTNAENLVLPATTMSSYCYRELFNECTSLTTAPELSATTLASNCYERMFGSCESLTTAPELPATTLTNNCYYDMFNGCTSLNSIACLATDIQASNCTRNWVMSVAANGTFTKAASMSSWTRGDYGIPRGWTVQDYQA